MYVVCIIHNVHAQVVEAENSITVTMYLQRFQSGDLITVFFFVKNVHCVKCQYNSKLLRVCKSCSEVGEHSVGKKISSHTDFSTLANRRLS